MEIGSALIGLLIIGLCTIPFLLLNKSKKSREKQLIQALFRLAERKNNHIDEYETGRDFAIGIDRIARTVFFYKIFEEQETMEVIRLDDVEHCEPKTVSRNLPPDRGGRKVIDRISLVFRWIEDEPLTSWDIYNSEENIQLSGELQLTERWCQKIRELLAAATA